MTTPTDTLSPIQEAVAAARAEITARGEPDPFTGEVIEPPASGQEDGIEALAEEDQADQSAEEQAQEVLDTPDDGDSDETEEVLGDLELEEQEPEAAPAAPDSYDVPGMDEPVPVQELINGYLRQSDYTRKTQEVARERETNAKALQFYQALTQHPKELAKQLGVAAGFLEADAQPIQVVELPFRPDEDIESEIERRVEEALASHPDIEAARNYLTLQWVEEEFSRIEREVFEGKTLGPKSRDLILKEADKAKTDDLEMVARALKTRQAEKARDTEKLKRSAPVKPTGKASTSTVTAEPESPLDAVMLAASEAGVELDVSKLNLK